MQGLALEVHIRSELRKRGRDLSEAADILEKIPPDLSYEENLTRADQLLDGQDHDGIGKVMDQWRQTLI